MNDSVEEIRGIARGLVRRHCEVMEAKFEEAFNRLDVEITGKSFRVFCELYDLGFEHGKEASFIGRRESLRIAMRGDDQ